ncbi:MAG: DUF1549 domain-containing protein [Pirellulales bacterium]
MHVRCGPRFVSRSMLPLLLVGAAASLMAPLVWAADEAKSGEQGWKRGELAAPDGNSSGEVELPSGVSPTTVIDLLVEAGWQRDGATPSDRCDDATFVRRIHLDLAGRIPTVQEAEAFLADTSSDKRATLVDKLLTSEEYARHMAEVFDVVLMGRVAEMLEGDRRAARLVRDRDSHGWPEYLRRSFSDNRPWDQMVREMLLARPTEPEQAGSSWFLYERNEDAQRMAEAVSPAIFGVRIDCAQCHDHPLAFEIAQAHYWGLVSFFRRTKNGRSGGDPVVEESAIGGFEQFADLSGQTSEAVLTFLEAGTVEEPRPADGEKQEDSADLYVSVELSSGEQRVPKFSRRERLVEEVVDGNPLVPRAMVNRMWALLVGRGLVHPVDLMDSMHPPSHPRLLDWLAEDFAASGFDVKRLVRSIVLSRAYQLDGRATGEHVLSESFAHALEKPLSAESYCRSMLVAIEGNAEAEAPELTEAFCEIFPEVFPEENLATLKQTLFLSNNNSLWERIRGTSGGTAEALVAIEDAGDRVREAFRRVYGRAPDEEELQAATQFLTERSADSRAAVDQLLWAMITSAEFRFNH